MTTAEPILYNPFEPGYFDDPYRQFAMLRELDPVHATLDGNWMLFRYDDCFRVLRDHTLSVDDRNIRQSRKGEQMQALRVEDRGEPSMLGNGTNRAVTPSSALVSLAMPPAEKSAP